MAKGTDALKAEPAMSTTIGRTSHRPGKRNFAGRDRARKVAHKAALRHEMPIADAVARR